MGNGTPANLSRWLMSAESLAENAQIARDVWQHQGDVAMGSGKTLGRRERTRVHQIFRRTQRRWGAREETTGPPGGLV